MVQSLGISVGNANSYVAAGQGGGIEIFLNEFSNRSTPSMVAFTERSRSIGTEASSNLFMNMKNTVYDLMVLLGKPFKEVNPENYPFKIEEGPGGQVLVLVRHLGEERKFTITQVLAMLLTKLRNIAGDSLDCVLSCPQFYNDSQKTALIQAALIAGLNPLQVITDMSAIILNYAYYRTTKADTNKFIAFINFGQSNLQSAIAWLKPKEDTVRILAAESAPIGGRDFDNCLAEYFIKMSNLNLNQKSRLKLTSACEKLKRLLSANANEIPLNVESLISEDKDYSARIERATFEEISQHLLVQAEDCFRRTLENAKSNFEKFKADEALAMKLAAEEDARKAAEQAANKAKEEANKAEDEASKAKDGDSAPEDATPPAAEEAQEAQAASVTDVKQPTVNPVKKDIVNFELHGVQMVGGSIRIPAIKQIIQNVFNMAPSTTLNTDEAVACGCVLHCATLHPGVKVKREVKILNVEPFSKPSGLTCDKDLRRVELELITADSKYKSRTEARNSLEEYIYTERSKLKGGDQLMEMLSTELDWLFTDEGEDASEEVYNTKLAELRQASEARLVADRMTAECEANSKTKKAQPAQPEPMQTEPIPNEANNVES